MKEVLGQEGANKGESVSGKQSGEEMEEIKPRMGIGKIVLEKVHGERMVQNARQGGWKRIEGDSNSD